MCEETMLSFRNNWVMTLESVCHLGYGGGENDSYSESRVGMEGGSFPMHMSQAKESC